MFNLELFKDVVEIRYVGGGDDELGSGTFYLIFEWPGSMDRALKAYEAQGFSDDLSFGVHLEENKIQGTFILRDNESCKTYSTGLVHCTEKDISDFKTEDAIGDDTFAFGLIKVSPAQMSAIKVKHGTAYRK